MRYFKSQSLLWVGTFLLLFSCLVLSKLHGFSIAEWHRILDDGSEPTEVLLGKARGIRSDDFSVTLPLAIGQVNSIPKFSCTNENIGTGRFPMLLVPRTLCFSGMGWLASLLRPTAWGFLFGVDIGLSWLWWSNVLGLFCVVYLLIMVWSNGRFQLGFFASLGFLFAPFHQFWAMNQAEIFVYGLATLYCWLRLLKTSRLFETILAVLGMAYFASAFALTLYPPTQIMVAYFIVGVGFYSLLQSWRSPTWQGKQSQVLAGLVGALFLVLGILGPILWQGKSIIDLMTHTAYPGQRTALGGGIPLWSILRGGLLPSRSVGDWSEFGNVCEAAGFVLLAPLAIVLLLRKFRRTNWDSLRPLSFAFGFLMLLVIWMMFGFPETVARISLLSLVPAPRAMAGIGLWDLFIWTSFCAYCMDHPETFQHERSRAFWIGWGLWASLLLWTAFQLHRHADISYGRLLPFAVLGVFMFWSFHYRPRWVPIGFAIWNLALTFHFNPLAGGSARYLYDNQLSLVLRQVFQQYPGEKWLVESHDLVKGNLPRMLGIPSVSGSYIYPDLDLWRPFDSSGMNQIVYNRYAHVDFYLQNGEGVSFNLVSPDAFEVHLNPSNPLLEKMGVRIFLVEGDRTDVFPKPQFDRIAQIGNHNIFRRAN